MNRGWSINRSHWEALALVLSTESTWSSVLLTPNDQSMVPASPGVYAICARPPTAAGSGQRSVFQSLASPLYIGRSESSIRKRFLNHCKSSDPALRKAKLCYPELRFWFVEMSAGAVKDAEALLIQCFGPPVNKVAGAIRGTIKPPVAA